MATFAPLPGGPPQEFPRPGIPEWLPAWLPTPFVAARASIMNDAAGTQAKKCLTMYHVSGPACRSPWAPCATFAFYVCVVSQVTLQALAWHWTACVDGQVTIPIWVNVPWLVGFLFVKWSECTCFRMISIPLVQWIGPLKIMGISCNWGSNGRIGFWIWATWEILNTLSQGSTRRSESISAIAVIKQLWCQRDDDPRGPLFEQWHSLPTLFPPFIVNHLGDDTMLFVASLALLAMIIESVWYFLLTWTIPSANAVLYGRDTATGNTNKGPVTYDTATGASLAQISAGTAPLGTWGEGFEVLMSRCSLYSTNHTGDSATIPDRRQRLHMYHADRLMLLAEPSGMHSLRGFFTDWCLARARQELLDGKLIRPISIVGMQMRKIVIRSCFESVTNMCAMQIHITLLAYDRSSGIFGMVIMLLSAVLQAYDQVGCLKSVWSFWTSAGQNVQQFSVDCQAAANDHTAQARRENDENIARAEENLKGLKCSWWLVFVILIVYVWVVVDVALKFVWVFG